MRRPRAGTLCFLKPWSCRDSMAVDEQDKCRVWYVNMYVQLKGDCRYLRSGDFGGRGVGLRWLVSMDIAYERQFAPIQLTDLFFEAHQYLCKDIFLEVFRSFQSCPGIFMDFLIL